MGVKQLKDILSTVHMNLHTIFNVFGGAVQKSYVDNGINRDDVSQA